jgi:pimeloyl-ACP methyl ester carboxylesterase
MPEAMVNGVRIWYQETGQGDPVVQIHGAGFGHFNFATATPILSKSFRINRHPVIHTGSYKLAEAA